MQKQPYEKYYLSAIWLCIGGGMLTLLIAAIGKRIRDTAKIITITIKGAQNNFFIDEKDVEQLLMKAAKGRYQRQTSCIFQPACNWNKCWKKMPGSKMRTLF